MLLLLLAGASARSLFELPRRRTILELEGDRALKDRDLFQRLATQLRIPNADTESLNGIRSMIDSIDEAIDDIENNRLGFAVDEDDDDDEELDVENAKLSFGKRKKWAMKKKPKTATGTKVKKVKKAKKTPAKKEEGQKAKTKKVKKS